MLVKKIIVLFCLGFALASFAQEYSMFGKQSKPSPIYKPNEKMKFNIKLLLDGKVIAGKKMKWVRTGDDGIRKSGEGVSSTEGLEIVTATAKPGFVRIYVTAFDADGKPILGAKNRRGKIKPVFFDGGACVDPNKLQGLPEPKDFDQFWAQQKKLLKSVPMTVIEMKEVPGNGKIKAFDVKISCAGKMPVSGYLIMPRNAKKKSLAAEVSFLGYGVKGAVKNLGRGKNQIYFNINAHGLKNGQPKDFYKKLQQGSLKKYGFDQQKNSDRKTTYFHDMFLRIMRSLEFVKSLPEWNGKDLKVSGHSQGGLQALAAAGLDKDITNCHAVVPWCCDFGREKLNRIVNGWHIKHTKALEYYDPINLIKRANPNCKLTIVAGLGDYTCPPSGVWVVFNNFTGEKSIELRQGCEHGFKMKNYPKFVTKKARTQ
jgi:cephalosporin-C deacetylase-like acetyl esterase